MQPVKRQKKPLLTAAVGIASVSYVGALEACADVEPNDEDFEGGYAYDDDEPDVGEAREALVVGTTANAVILKPLPPSGNLMGPDTPQLPGGGVVIRIPIPVGNLMVIPIDQLKASDLAQITAGVH